MKPTVEKPMSKKIALASTKVNLSKSVKTARVTISKVIHTPCAIGMRMSVVVGV